MANASVPPLPPPARALLLGVATGLRSQLPLAVLAVEASQDRFDPGGGPLARVLESRGGLAGLVAAAAAELVADKLPVTPSRLSAGPFLRRLTVGAAVGAAVHRDAAASTATGVVLGALGAAAGAAAGARFRSLAAERTRVPDVVWAVLEDLAAAGLAVAVVAAGRRGR
jgi:uncharacterized membrane protein